MAERKRYALVGTGGRGFMYTNAITKEFKDTSKLVALCDISQTRMDYYNTRLGENEGFEPAPTFPADQFDQMVEQTRPDVVIVTSMDCTHHQYIIRAMELGCDVISEKPMTTDEIKAKAIFETREKTGRSLRVTFNYRYAPFVTKVRELLMNEVIGKPLHVDFQWVLDVSHGADYFRRWHREKDKSGGLLVHKSTHHFDLINWWIDSFPKEVFAMGDLKFYGKENAASRGETYDYDRYTGAENAKDDPFALTLDSSKRLTSLYKDAEKDTGYIRDRNVFGENITIEDTMMVNARYRNGVSLGYSLLAYSPWEGWKASITGTKGRLEVELVEGFGKIFVGEEDETLKQRKKEIKKQFGREQIRVWPMFDPPYDVEVTNVKGDHGGGDKVLLEQLFAENPPEDPFNRAASHIDGAASILMGICANKSIETGKRIIVDDVFALPEKE